MNRRKFLQQLLIAPCVLVIPKIAPINNEREQYLIDNGWMRSKSLFQNHCWTNKNLLFEHYTLDGACEIQKLLNGNPHSSNEFDGIADKLKSVDWNMKPNPSDVERIKNILKQCDCEYQLRWHIAD